MLFRPGDKVKDKDGDEGIVLIPAPDTMGYIVWVLTKQGSKYGRVGIYCQDFEEDLKLLESAAEETQPQPLPEVPDIWGKTLDRNAESLSILD